MRYHSLQFALLMNVAAALCLNQALLADESTQTQSEEGRNASELQKMLDAGFQVGRTRLDAAVQCFSAAKRHGGDGPRLDYGYGLVLLKQLQYVQAVAAFDRAAKSPGAWRMRAMKAAAWVSLSRKKYKDGLKRVSDLVDLLSQSEPHAMTERDRTLLAHWIGQVMETLAVIMAETADESLLEPHVRYVEKNWCPRCVRCTTTGDCSSVGKLCRRRNWKSRSDSRVRVSERD